MPRVRTLATVLLLIIVPSLFIYYLYYDSIQSITSSSTPIRYPDNLHTDSSIGGSGANGYPFQLHQQPVIQQDESQQQHKYSGIWRHLNRFNQSSSSSASASISSYSSINLPEDFHYIPIEIPQHPSSNETKDSNPEIESRRQFIKQMMQEAWNSYVKYAWGFNELQPLTRDPKLDSIFGATKLGLTIVDSLDTLFLMDMHDEFEMGRKWIAEQLDFHKVETEISVFETIIRYVGGLLTCYALTGDAMFLFKAKQIAQILLPAYNTATGIPYGLIIPKTGKSYHHTWAYGSILSEFGSHHLEFTYLSAMTKDPKFLDRVKNTREFLQKIDKPNGLYMLMVDNNYGRWTDNKVSLGALGDSFYEYLIKSYVQSGHQDQQALKMYLDAMDAIDQSGMINQSVSGHLTYVSDLVFGKPTNKMQHLTCFAGGMYMLGTHHMAEDLNLIVKDDHHHHNNNTSTNHSTIVSSSTSSELNKLLNENRLKRHFNLAVNLTETCYQSYHRTPTKLGPESFYFTETLEAINRNGDYYILRPETIESYFIMWRLTHDQRYRDYAWEAAQAIYKQCHTGHGYTGIYNVMKSPGTKDNTQQSFFLAETLKYLYLIFSNDKLLPLDQWVFNTEAHPLPICGKNPAYPSSICNKIYH